MILYCQLEHSWHDHKSAVKTSVHSPFIAILQVHMLLTIPAFIEWKEHI